jgi:hypothetical protein
MPLRHNPVVPSWVVRRAPRASYLDSRGLCVLQSDGGGCAHRIRMVDGGRIPFGRHGVRREVRGGQCSHHPLDPDVNGLVCWALSDVLV